MSSIEVDPKEGAGPFRRVRAPAPVPYDRPRAPAAEEAPKPTPLSEEKQQDERIQEVVTELLQYSEPRLEGDWTADAAGESTPGSFDLVQMWRWARMFVTAAHGGRHENGRRLE